MKEDERSKADEEELLGGKVQTRKDEIFAMALVLPGLVGESDARVALRRKEKKKKKRGKSQLRVMKDDDPIQGRLTISSPFVKLPGNVDRGEESASVLQTLHLRNEIGVPFS
jgi:hypothetical protein